jgi:hypothetical protein
MAKLTTPTLTTLLALAGLACESRCEEQQHTLELDEPGPFGASSRETFGFIEGTRTGTLWWSDLDEQVDVVVTTTLDTTATAIRRERRGHGRERLACPDTFVTWAHVRIATPDAVYFDDEVDVWLEQWNGDLPEWVETQTDVTHHEFEGLLIEPPSAVDDLGLTLRMVWRDDAAGSLQGWLMLGGDELVRFEATSN